MIGPRGLSFGDGLLARLGFAERGADGRRSRMAPSQPLTATPFIDSSHTAVLASRPCKRRLPAAFWLDRFGMIHATAPAEPSAACRTRDARAPKRAAPAASRRVSQDRGIGCRPDRSTGRARAVWSSTRRGFAIKVMAADTGAGLTATSTAVSCTRACGSAIDSRTRGRFMRCFIMRLLPAALFVGDSPARASRRGGGSPGRGGLFAVVPRQ